MTTLRFEPEISGVQEGLGGAGRLLVDGRPLMAENAKAESVSVSFMERQHPRTFIGLSKDSSTLFLCVVDGRQKKSIGMSFGEMQEFLLRLGAWQALNFDGGGSTTMVVNGSVVNSPSDKTGERPVANIFLVRRKFPPQ
jgi:exopolysaccharide biosynthesis protein